MIGTLDKKRGIVNVMVVRDGRRTCLSMDEGLAGLGEVLFGGDRKAFASWLQRCVDEIDAKMRQAALQAELGEQVGQYSSMSRMVQREIVELAKARLQEVERQADRTVISDGLSTSVVQSAPTGATQGVSVV